MFPQDRPFIRKKVLKIARDHDGFIIDEIINEFGQNELKGSGIITNLLNNHIQNDNEEIRNLIAAMESQGFLQAREGLGKIQYVLTDKGAEQLNGHILSARETVRKSMQRFAIATTKLIAEKDHPLSGRDIRLALKAQKIGGFLGVSKFYGRLNRMEDADLIKVKEENPRKYALTAEGRKLANEDLPPKPSLLAIFWKKGPENGQS